MSLQEVLEELERQLPAWMRQGQAIRIFAGVELGVKKFKDEPWRLKIARCNFCGECCTLQGPGWQGTTVKARRDGYCIELIPKDDEQGKYLCDLGAGRPFSCCAYAAGPNDGGICCIRWESLG